MSMQVGALAPGLPHILLAADKNPGYKKLNEAFKKFREDLEQQEIDLLILYSTYWPSVIGHQIQARETAEWVHVDDQFHDLGSTPYTFHFDKDFAELYKEKAQNRGLHTRTVDYHGFPIDTGSVMVMKLLNGDNRWPATIVSSNVYSDRAETIVLGKAARDAVEASGRKAAAISISSLSNRLFETAVSFEEDGTRSLKDEEWNEKFLEFLDEGRLEDVSQLSRQFHQEARVPKVTNFKPFWWLAAAMGQSNLYKGHIYGYAPIQGTGNALVSLTPSNEAAKDLEFDEDDTDYYSGDRNVLGDPEPAEKSQDEPSVEEDSP